MLTLVEPLDLAADQSVSSAKLFHPTLVMHLIECGVAETLQMYQYKAEFWSCDSYFTYGWIRTSSFPCTTGHWAIQQTASGPALLLQGCFSLAMAAPHYHP